MIILIDAENVFNKTQYPDKKTLSKVGLEGTYFNITKSMYDKHTANIIFNREKLKHLEQDKEVCFHHS